MSIQIADKLQYSLSIAGEASLLDAERTLILNSRQSKTPTGSDAWVRKTINAIRSTIDAGDPVIASIGLNTWELALWAVGEFGGNAIVVLPEPSHGSVNDEIGRISIDYNLHPDHHAWVFLPRTDTSRSIKSWWETRDGIAYELARRIIPVSIRPHGRLDGLIYGSESDKLIEEKFRTGYSNRAASTLNMDLPEECADYVHWNFITHWTCRCYGPWPGELSADFYRDIASSTNGYPRSAGATLKRILAERKLRSSGNHMRNGTSAVAFTACEPSEALKLMKWRRRYVRPTFEPYGIAIHYRTALSRGLRPVTYVESGKEDHHSSTPEFMQGYGTGEWRNEKEWRAIGDVDLASIPDDDLLVLVPRTSHAEEFQSLTNIRVESLENRV